MKKTTKPSPVRPCRRFRPQPHRTVIIFATDLHHRSNEAFSSLFLCLSLWPTKAEKLTRSLIYKPISLPSASLDPPTDLATIRPTCRSRCYQTHPPISPPSDPPTNLWSFISLFLSIYLSLSFSHDRCLFLRKIFFFFLLCFFVDLVYIFRFLIIIFVWKLRKCERMCFL